MKILPKKDKYHSVTIALGKLWPEKLEIFYAEMLHFTKCVLVSLQEYNNFLLKSYFNLWWSNATQQRRYEKDIIERAEENRKTQRINSSFCFWRHHLRATLVAR